LKKSQYETIDQALDLAAEAVTVVVSDGIESAMNRFNRRDREAAASNEAEE